jgi:hypothetical protein
VAPVQCSALLFRWPFRRGEVVALLHCPADMTSKRQALIGAGAENTFEKFLVRPRLRSTELAGNAMLNLVEPLHLVNLLRVGQLRVRPNRAGANCEVVRQCFVEAPSAGIVEGGYGVSILNERRRQICSSGITDQHSTAGTAPTDFEFTRTLVAVPVRCSAWSFGGGGCREFN